jgi:hypothetical protein
MQHPQPIHKVPDLTHATTTTATTKNPNQNKHTDKSSICGRLLYELCEPLDYNQKLETTERHAQFKSSDSSPFFRLPTQQQGNNRSFKKSRETRLGRRKVP